MKVEFISEPELQFGYDFHIDVRYGILNYNPFDVENPLAPKLIKLGLVGTNESIERALKWLQELKNEIICKESRLKNFFVKFPGFNNEAGFKSDFVIDSKLHRVISQVDIDKTSKHTNKEIIIKESAELFIKEIEYLVQKERLDVIICAIPKNLVIALFNADNKITETDSSDNLENSSRKNNEKELIDNFRRYIKAKSMKYRIPLQLILPHTCDDNIKYGKGIKVKEDMQDKATRAWNFCTALYYKANGTPWRLINNSTASTTCCIGISFYKPLNQKTLQTSLAQVFNEKGNGIILRGSKINITKEDKIPHLSEEESYNLLIDALELYKMEHNTLPSRVVLHKSSNFTNIERLGFISALIKKGINEYDLITIFKSTTKLFRLGNYPPLRGTKLELDEKNHILYTRGSVPYYQTYPGQYVPKAIEVRCIETQQTPLHLCREILGLTKMNWNNTQFDGSLPITLRASLQVKDILKYINDDEFQIEPRYSFYM